MHLLLNNTTTAATPPHQTDPETLFLWYVSYGIIEPVICGVGIIGNLLNLLVLNRHKFRLISYSFIRWMALSDLLSLVFLLPEVPMAGYGQHITNEFSAIYHCYVSYAVINVFFVSSALLVVCLTVERHVAVCCPTRVAALMNSCRVKMMIAFAYVIPIILYIPYFLQREIVYPTGESKRFRTQWSPLFANFWYRRVYQWVRVILFKMIPIVVTLILNITTTFRFRQVLERRRAIKMSGQRPSKSEMKKMEQQNKLMVLLLAVAVVYLALLTPMAVLFLLDNPDRDSDYGFQVFKCVANLAEQLNSATNFFMYSMVSKDFRGELGRLFRCDNGRFSTQGGDHTIGTTTAGNNRSNISCRSQDNLSNLQLSANNMETNKLLVNHCNRSTLHVDEDDVSAALSDSITNL